MSAVKAELPGRQLAVYAGLLLTLLIPFALTLATVREPLLAPDLTHNPTPHGYTVSLTIFALPVLAFALWLARHPSYQVEKRAYFGCILGVFLFGAALDCGLGHAFFYFPNTGAVCGLRLPAFAWVTRSWVPAYLPIEEFGFYLLGSTYMISLYLWGVLFWFNRYNHRDHRAVCLNMPRILSFNGKAFVTCLALVGLGIVAKKLGPNPLGFPGYFTFLVLLALLPCSMLYDVTQALINWRAFTFMAFVLLLISLVYEATLGVPYGWWAYHVDQMLGWLIVGWAQLPVEAVLLWLAAAFGTVLFFEALRLYYYMERPLGAALLGGKPRDARGGTRQGQGEGQEQGPRPATRPEPQLHELPPYVDDGIGFPVPRGPYVNTRVDMANFIVKVDHAQLLKLCDRYLNQLLPQDVRYWPFLSVVMMTYAKIVGYATDSAGRRLGLIPETDLVFWVPTLAVRHVMGVPVPSHIAMFPYRLYVDSALGLSTGREVFGFQKTFGTFTDNGLIKTPEFALKTLGFTDYTPESFAEMLPTVSLERQQDSGSQPSLNAEFTTAAAVWQAWLRLLLGHQGEHLVATAAGDLTQFLASLWHPSTTSVSIKQCRDVRSPLAACLQQVIEAKSTIDQFFGGGLLAGTYAASFPTLVSDPTARDLGIQVTAGKQHNLAGFWVSTAFTMQMGTVLS